MQACPFNVPRYEWNKVVPGVAKCDFCAPRQAQGLMPACAEACPEEATVFGTRDELLAEAHRRIAEKPDAGYDPHVYGEERSWAARPCSSSRRCRSTQLGYPTALPHDPLPTRTWASLSHVPGRHLDRRRRACSPSGGSPSGATKWRVSRARTAPTVCPREVVTHERHQEAAVWFLGRRLLDPARFGIATAFMRFTRGLGSVTNLSDTFPWGLWIGFDILCGVGLAAGGFTITAIVYLFHLERFRPIVRPAILTAFLGYLLVVVGLLFDLGRPWNIWHPLIMWNPHSVMFEIAWCVTLYTTVLALEFSGMVFEKLGWTRALNIQHAVTIPLVILGVILSTLHQSSLGALYLIVPGKLHALWYTERLPVIFWLSAVGGGLAMVIVESRLSARALGRHLELPLIREIGRALLGVLGVLIVFRLRDLYARGVLEVAFRPSYEAALFQVEFMLGLVAPFVLLLLPRVRRNANGLYAASLLTVLGFIANRLNVSITGLEASQRHYIPAAGEVLVTLMLVALGFGAFKLAAKYLPVYPPLAGSAPPGATPGVRSK